MRGMAGVIVAVLLAAAAGLGGAVGASATAATGITLLEDTVLSEDGRLHELTVHSAVLGETTRLRVLLPAAYDEPAAAGARYPMLLLLHGASSDQRSWTEATDLEAHTAAHDLIVVMPNGGPNSFYSDWLDGPQWETHILDELVPWIDATYRTVGTRAGRAIAGLSMGGFGSMSYAARHPDRFLAAAAFSGGVDLADAGVAEALALQALGLGDDRRWGPYVTHEANWRGHNPPDLAANLRGMAVRLATGNGVPCAGDNAEFGIIEGGVYLMNIGFAARLNLAGVPHELELRPCGTHEWHYWDRDIATWLPPLMALFASPPPPPSAFDYRVTDAEADVWGWSFTARRPATEFLDLRAVSAAGLTAMGSGPVDVVTAPLYEPGATYSLASTSAGVITVPVALVPPLGTLPPSGPGTVLVVADTGGRLSFTIDLGPAHTADQYSPAGLAAEALGVGSYFRTATVAIATHASAPAAAPAPAAVVPSEPVADTLPATGATAPGWPMAAALAAALVLRAATRDGGYGRAGR